MSGGKKRFRTKISAQKLKAKRISARMKARVRRKRAREVDTVTETPISLRSKFAWVTIVLMVLVIVAACIRVHPYHCRVEYAMTETDENPYMGTLDAEDGYLVSAEWSWLQAEPKDGEYTAPELEPLKDGARYVIMFNADEVPAHISDAAQQSDAPDELISERLRRCVTALCTLMGDAGQCAYIQTDAPLNGVDPFINGVSLLCKASDGLYRAPGGSEISWQTSPVAGTSSQIFGNHLTYVLGGEDENIAGRVGWAFGVRYAEWHSSTRRGDRLFVNMTLDNAGVTSPYRAHDVVLTLWRGGKICASTTHQIDLTKLSGEPVQLDGYIDVPYDVEKGLYSLRVSINVRGDETARLSLTMPSGEDGYYDLGSVVVK